MSVTQIQVEAFGKSDTGRKRSSNQDSMLIADLSGNDGYILDGTTEASAPGHFALRDNGALLLVADGMGGAAAGDVASRMVVAHIRALFANGASADAGSFPEQLQKALESANGAVHGEALRDMKYYGMGSTATLAGLLEDRVYFAQVGDSRAYVIRAGVAVQVTRDQSFVQDMIDAGKMTEQEAERSEHANMIMQAIGASPNVEPVVTEHPARRGDIIMLCSDGLTRVVRNEEIGEIAARSADTTAMCKELIDLANARGGPDNITVVAARLDGAGLQEPAGGETVTRTNYQR